MYNLFHSIEKLNKDCLLIYFIDICNGIGNGRIVAQFFQINHKILNLVYFNIFATFHLC